MTGSLDGRKVLIVDDNADLLVTLVEQLTRKLVDTSTVVGVHDAEAALRLLSQGGFGAIVSDHRLPRSSGLALLVAAREAAPGVVRILMTGDPEPRLAVNAFANAAVARCFIKPVDMDALARVLRHAMEPRRPTGARARHKHAD